MKFFLFLIFLVLESSCESFWHVALAGEGDGEVRFYTYYLKESPQIRYRSGEALLPQGLKAIERLFRSRDSGKVLPIDPCLVEILDRIEDHFGVRQVEIISGYRSLAFNQSLKETGHTVANESFHIKGMAADIHLDEITEEALRDYALSLKKGGVGFYPSLHMVHVDVGPVRAWGGAAPRKAWVGEKNEAAPFLLTVFPDRTLNKKLDRIEIEPSEGIRLEPRLEIEFFDRGTWKVVGQTPLSLDATALKDLPYGKYRLKSYTQGRRDLFQYSNEFYLKKI